jgi:hypothetical protein
MASVRFQPERRVDNQLANFQFYTNRGNIMSNHCLNLFVAGVISATIATPLVWGEDLPQPNHVTVLDRQREIYVSSTSSLQERLSTINLVRHICVTSTDSKAQVLGLEFLSLVSISADSEFVIRALALGSLNKIVTKFVEIKDDTNTLKALAKVQIVLDAEVTELPLKLFAINQIYQVGVNATSEQLKKFTRTSLIMESASETQSPILVASAADKLASLDKLKPAAVPPTQTQVTTPPDLSKQPLAASDFGQSAGNVSNSVSDRMGVSVTRNYDAAKDFLDGKRPNTKPKTEPKTGNTTGATPARGAAGLTFKPTFKP